MIVWKPIKGYEEYQISNRGTIISPRGRVLKSTLNNRGYLTVKLRQHTCNTHRLVAETFLPNPDNLPQVNHKDEVKTHNYIHINPNGSVNPEKSNLEWCTAEYNTEYSLNRKKRVKNGKTSRPVKQYTLEGKYVKEYPSLSEVFRQTGYDRGFINNCCLGKYSQAYGYLWKFAL